MTLGGRGIVAAHPIQPSTKPRTWGDEKCSS